MAHSKALWHAAAMFMPLLLLACGADRAPPSPTTATTDDTDDTDDTGDTGTLLATQDTGDSGSVTDTVDTTPLPCAWSGSDPGSLGPETGNQPGDTFTDLAVTDQCLNDLDLWTLAGEYHLLYFTGTW